MHNTVIQLADHISNYPYMFCGTTTGDILAVNMKPPYQLQFQVPNKELFTMGVTTLSILKCEDNTFDFLVGTGSGIVGRYETKVSVVKGHKVQGTWKHHSGVEYDFYVYICWRCLFHGSF